MLIEIIQDTIEGLKAGQRKNLPGNIAIYLINKGIAIEIKEVVDSVEKEVKQKKVRKNEKNNIDN